jgi:pyruvate,water dikinase
LAGNTFGAKFSRRVRTWLDSMQTESYIRWFKDIKLAEVPLVGGKNASLGELYSALSTQGIAVPNGFALTAQAYRDALGKAGAWERLHRLLDGVDKEDVKAVHRWAAEARRIVFAPMEDGRLQQEAADAYRELEQQYGRRVAVAVRSSATAEDLPTASFAGQHESFLNIRGFEDLFEACRRCFASTFTDRAIAYRIDNGFDHFKVALSVGVMKMIRADRASSGVIFTLDTESGFRDIVLITGAYGLGENVVQGKTDPDEFYVHKPTFRQGHPAVLSRSLGAKQIRMVYARAHSGRATTKNVSTSKADRERFCINDKEVLELADCAIKIEEHYSLFAGHSMPMDIEWAKDGEDGRLYIVQARPETVASRRAPEAFEIYTLKSSAPIIVSGKAVGEKIATGRTRVIKDVPDLARFCAGEVLVSASTSPDWEPVMKTAAGIVTDRGGRTCHAAIVARELGLPAWSARKGPPATHRGHDQSWRSGSCLSIRDAAERRGGPCAHGVHHQRAHWGTSDGPGVPGLGEIAKGPRRHQPSRPALCRAGEFLHRKAVGRHRHHRRRILSKAGHRPVVRFQDQ